ncbi:hypothetical protein ACHAXN_002981 [Cyclotella atomus]
MHWQEQFKETAPSKSRCHIKVMPSITQRGSCLMLFLLRKLTPTTFFVCMILPGGGLRLQTFGGLATELFDSTLRTWRGVSPSSFRRLGFQTWM